MSFWNWIDKRKQTLTMWDISILKTYCMLIGMVLGAYLAIHVKAYLGSFILVIVACAIWLVYKMFFKKSPTVPEHQR